MEEENDIYINMGSIVATSLVELGRAIANGIDATKYRAVYMEPEEKQPAYFGRN